MEKHERLRAARKAMFSSAKAAADAMGIGASTYTHHENGTRDFDLDAARLYARKFKVPVEWLALGQNEPRDIAAASGPAETGIPIVGEVRAGMWLELGQQGEIDQWLPIMPDSSAGPGEQFAVKVVGDSMNKVFPPGSFAIVLKWDREGMDGLKSGDIVVVRRQRAMTYEATLKRAVMMDGKWNLYPESTNPRYAPLIMGEKDHGEDVIIIGKVIGKYERMP